MDSKEIALLKSKWQLLLQNLNNRFDSELDLQGVLFLIGVQELGKGYRQFSKSEKGDLMHIATCKLLSQYGYYVLNGIDVDGWPHWELMQPLPPLTLREQDLLLKQAAIEYFEAEIFG
ncbi:MAG: hypothetical protein JNK61_10905 [Bacteroidia bacterium]|nr:hypothetical protein [Bacteroidia bacterium]